MDDLVFGLIDIMLGFEPSLPKIPIIVTVGKIIASDGVFKAIEQYRELKRQRPDIYDFSESQLNMLGYRLIGNERPDDAVEIFKLNVEMFPESANTYDSLAEAYKISGNKELAIENYKKSIALNPNNSNGVKMLESLQSNDNY